MAITDILDVGSGSSPVEREIAKHVQATALQQAQNEARGGFHATGVSYNPGYWLSEQGQQEVRQKKTAQAATDLEGLVNEFRAGNIDADQLAASKETLEKDHGAGILAKFPEWRIFTKAQDTAEDRRRARKAERELQAARSMFEGPNQEMDLQQRQKVMSDVVGEYGYTFLLAHSPTFREMEGQAEQFEQQKQGLLQATAEEWGVRPEALMFDEETGQVTANRNYLTTKAADQSLRDAEMEPVRERRQQELDRAKDQFDVEMKMLNQDLGAFDPNKPDQRVSRSNYFREKASEAYKKYRDRRAEILGAGPQDVDPSLVSAIHGAQDQGQPAATQQTAPEAPATHPKLPAGVQLSQSFASPQEFWGANVQRNRYYTVGDLLVYVGVDGIPQEVK